MSAIFNGNSYLDVASNIVGSSINYPALVGGWLKITADPQVSNTFSVTDNTSTPNNEFGMTLRYDLANNPVTPLVGHNGSFAIFAGNQQVLNVPINQWHLWLLIFRSTTDRAIGIDSTMLSPSTTSIDISSLNVTRLGGLVYNNGTFANGYIGRMGEWFFASGNAALNTNLASIQTALNSGTSPINVADLAPYLNNYQPLRTGLNEGGYVGLNWTNNNVTFDGSDHPPIIGGIAPRRNFIGGGVVI